MIRATCLGHATLLVETERCRVLMDPILGSAISGGGNVIDPPRVIDTSLLTNLDLIVISHHHSDHYNLSDLDQIPDVHGQHFVIPDDERMHATLLKWGVSAITRLKAGESIASGDLRITATPSAVSFPEMGILFEQGELRVLNLVDTVFHPVLDEVRKIARDAPNVILAPFQAGGYMCFLPLREGGPPPGLVPAIQMWSQEYLEELTQDLATLRPRLVVAFADGLTYVDEGINARHFPLPDSAFTDRLGEMNIQGCSARPGLIIESSENGVKTIHGESCLVQVFEASSASRAFNLDVPLRERPLSWYDLPHGGLGKAIDSDWLQKLTHCMDIALVRFAQHDNRHEIQRTLRDWHLEILYGGDRLHFSCVWLTNETPKWSHVQVEAEKREYGVICHGPDLAQVVIGNINLDVIILGGLFRYRSPEGDGDLEKLRGRTIRPLSWIFEE